VPNRSRLDIQDLGESAAEHLRGGEGLAALPEATIPTGVAARLKELGLRPRKGLGQHFLVSPGVVRRILKAAEVRPDQVIVEVGPGLGTLTQALAQAGAQVVGVELDGELAAALATAFQSYGPRVRIIHADARTQDLASLAPVGSSYNVVANLPYYVGSLIVRRFLESERKPRRLVVMLQREVARSMVGAPGKLSLLGVGVQLYGSPSIVATVPPGSFHPPPKVTSAIVRIDVHQEPLLPPSQEADFFSLVRAGFSAPRKQLRGAMSHALARPPSEIEGLLGDARIDPQRRAETLSLRDWLTLHSAWKERAWSP
jgi:16S rRNA (adenine1518-N6/adenine1519-N6)-dimethyltransferase